jgi:hypothetical protein
VTTALAHEFTRASGDRASDCAFIVQRYPEADGCFRPGRGESWVCVVRDGRMRLEMGGACWLTGLWRSPAGTLHVSDCAGQMHTLAPGETRWNSTALPGALLGVWGLDDRTVWAWGTRGDAPVLYRFDGAWWRDAPTPGTIVAMHGLDPSLVMAVGRDGLIARWNGADWHRLGSPVTEVLHGVCVVSEEAMYAVGPEGVFLEGSVWGWAVRTRRDHLLYSVGAHGGRVYVGSPFPDGLLALTPEGLETVERELEPYHFDTRADLLLANPYVIASSEDGAQWLRFAVADAVTLLASQPFTPETR